MNFDITASQLSAFGLTAAHHQALAQQAENRGRAKRLSCQGVVLVLLAFLAASCAGGLSYTGLHKFENNVIKRLPGTSSFGFRHSVVSFADTCPAIRLGLFADVRQQCPVHNDSAWTVAPQLHAAGSGALELDRSVDVNAEAAACHSFWSPLQQLQVSTPAGQGKDPQKCCNVYLPAISPNDVAPTKVPAASEICISGATEQQAPSKDAGVPSDLKAESATSATKPSLITVLDLTDHHFDSTRTAWLSMQAAQDEAELLGVALPAFSKASSLRSVRPPAADPFFTRLFWAVGVFFAIMFASLGVTVSSLWLQSYENTEADASQDAESFDEERERQRLDKDEMLQIIQRAAAQRPKLKFVSQSSQKPDAAVSLLFLEVGHTNSLQTDFPIEIMAGSLTQASGILPVQPFSNSTEPTLPVSRSVPQKSVLLPEFPALTATSDVEETVLGEDSASNGEVCDSQQRWAQLAAAAVKLARQHHCQQLLSKADNAQERWRRCLTTLQQRELACTRWLLSGRALYVEGKQGRDQGLRRHKFHETQRRQLSGLKESCANEKESNKQVSTALRSLQERYNKLGADRATDRRAAAARVTKLEGWLDNTQGRGRESQRAAAYWEAQADFFRTQSTADQQRFKQGQDHLAYWRSECMRLLEAQNQSQAHASQPAWIKAAIQTAAASKLQYAVRRYLVKIRCAQRKTANLQKAQVAAAHTIQAAWRRFGSRAASAKQRRAAVKIQAAVRGRPVRAHYICLKAAVALVQRKWRAHKARQRAAAATTVQRHWRGHSQRTQYSKLRKAAVTLQSAARRRTARLHYLRARASCLLIQRNFRAWQKKKNLARERATKDKFCRALFTVRLRAAFADWRATTAVKRDRKHKVRLLVTKRAQRTGLAVVKEWHQAAAWQRTCKTKVQQAAARCSTRHMRQAVEEWRHQACKRAALKRASQFRQRQALTAALTSWKQHRAMCLMVNRADAQFKKSSTSRALTGWKEYVMLAWEREELLQRASRVYVVSQLKNTMSRWAANVRRRQLWRKAKQMHQAAVLRRLSQRWRQTAAEAHQLARISQAVVYSRAHAQAQRIFVGWHAEYAAVRCCKRMYLARALQGWAELSLQKTNRREHLLQVNSRLLRGFVARVFHAWRQDRQKSVSHAAVVMPGGNPDATTAAFPALVTKTPADPAAIAPNPAPPPAPCANSDHALGKPMLLNSLPSGATAAASVTTAGASMTESANASSGWAPVGSSDVFSFSDMLDELPGILGNTGDACDSMSDIDAYDGMSDIDGSAHSGQLPHAGMMGESNEEELPEADSEAEVPSWLNPMQGFSPQLASAGLFQVPSSSATPCVASSGNAEAPGFVTMQHTGLDAPPAVFQGSTPAADNPSTPLPSWASSPMQGCVKTPLFATTAPVPSTPAAASILTGDGASQHWQTGFVQPSPHPPPSGLSNIAAAYGSPASSSGELPDGDAQTQAASWLNLDDNTVNVSAQPSAVPNTTTMPGTGFAPQAAGYSATQGLKYWGGQSWAAGAFKPDQSGSAAHAFMHGQPGSVAAAFAHVQPSSAPAGFVPVTQNLNTSHAATGTAPTGIAGPWTFMNAPHWQGGPSSYEFGTSQLPAGQADLHSTATAHPQQPMASPSLGTAASPTAAAPGAAAGGGADQPGPAGMASAGQPEDESHSQPAVAAQAAGRDIAAPHQTATNSSQDAPAVAEPPSLPTQGTAGSWTSMGAPNAGTAAETAPPASVAAASSAAEGAADQPAPTGNSSAQPAGTASVGGSDGAAAQQAATHLSQPVSSSTEAPAVPSAGKRSVAFSSAFPAAPAASGPIKFGLKAGKGAALKSSLRSSPAAFAAEPEFDAPTPGLASILRSRPAAAADWSQPGAASTSAATPGGAAHHAPATNPSTAPATLPASASATPPANAPASSHGPSALDAVIAQQAEMRAAIRAKAAARSQAAQSSTFVHSLARCVDSVDPNASPSRSDAAPGMKSTGAGDAGMSAARMPAPVQASPAAAASSVPPLASDTDIASGMWSDLDPPSESAESSESGDWGGADAGQASRRGGFDGRQTPSRARASDLDNWGVSDDCEPDLDWMLEPSYI